MSHEPATGETRCWPCTVANAVVGLFVAWLPLATVVLNGGAGLVAGTVVWGVVATAYTGYRLVRRGYLPLAEPAAKLTGLDATVGPGAGTDADVEREDDG